MGFNGHVEFFFLSRRLAPFLKIITGCFRLYSVSPGGVYGILLKNLLSLPIQYSTLFLVFVIVIVVSCNLTPKYFSRSTLSSIQMQEQIFRAPKYGVLPILGAFFSWCPV